VTEVPVGAIIAESMAVALIEAGLPGDRLEALEQPKPKRRLGRKRTEDGTVSIATDYGRPR
jgi:hypothetical protein